LEVCLLTASLPKTKTGFQALSLKSSVLSALARASYLEPTPIQSALIPVALTGRDVIGQAQTGTGKTAAFLLPFLNSWKENLPAIPQALVLAPTRELVVQVAEEAKKLKPAAGFRCLPIYGGQRFGGQLSELKKGCSLVVGSPGRVIDHLQRGTLNLSGLRYIVLDEADRMLDIGFRPDIERILKQCPAKRQTLLMSATLPDPVLRLTKRYLVDPVHLNLTPEHPTVDRIRQSYITVDEYSKLELLRLVMEQQKPRQCIIFCQRKRSADELYRELRQHEKRVAVMHGDLPQNLRNRIMQAFRDGKLTYLVATDVVGRGIDVTGISHIINYDLPEDPENYVHRIGRTGRMGKDGIAIAFVTPEQGKQLTAIELFINKQIETASFEGFQAFAPRVKEADPEPKAAEPVFGRPVRRYRRGL
jgi:ATP-dependent RNA helicase DeaD